MQQALDRRQRRAVLISPDHVGHVQERRAIEPQIDNITDYAIYMLDPTGRVASWNAGARRIKGYEAAEILGVTEAAVTNHVHRGLVRLRTIMEVD